MLVANSMQLISANRIFIFSQHVLPCTLIMIRIYSRRIWRCKIHVGDMLLSQNVFHITLITTGLHYMSRRVALLMDTPLAAHVHLLSQRINKKH